MTLTLKTMKTKINDARRGRLVEKCHPKHPPKKVVDLHDQKLAVACRHPAAAAAAVVMNGPVVEVEKDVRSPDEVMELRHRNEASLERDPEASREQDPEANPENEPEVEASRGKDAEVNLENVPEVEASREPEMKVRTTTEIHWTSIISCHRMRATTLFAPPLARIRLLLIHHPPGAIDIPEMMALEISPLTLIPVPLLQLATRLVEEATTPLSVASVPKDKPRSFTIDMVGHSD